MNDEVEKAREQTQATIDRMRDGTIKTRLIAKRASGGRLTPEEETELAEVQARLAGEGKDKV